MDNSEQQSLPIEFNQMELIEHLGSGIHRLAKQIGEVIEILNDSDTVEISIKIQRV